MAEDVGNLKVKVGMSTTEFDRGISTLRQKMQLIGQDFKLASSGLDKVSDASKISALRIKELTSKIDIQQKIVAEMAQRHKDLAEKTGENSKATLDYELKLKKAQGTLQKMEQELTDTTATLKKQSSAWVTASEKLSAVSTKLKTVGADMTAAGKSLTMGLTAPILAAATASVKLASDLEETTNKVNVAFGESAGVVKDWGETTLESFGLAKGTALDMASLFGDMGTAMGQTTGEAALMSTQLVGLAGDLASFKNIGIQQAQDALKGIFTGEGESLKSLGVIMLDTTLSAFALETGQKKLYKEMSQAEKVQLRFNYVMNATKNAQGDFARTSEGAANQARMLGEAVKEAGAEFGEILLPIITPMISKLREMVTEFGDLSEETQKTILVVAGIAAAIGPVLIVGGQLVTAVGAISGAMATMSASVAAAGGAMAVLTGPVGVAVLAGAAIAGMGIAVYAMGEETRKAAAEVKKLTGSIQNSSDAFDKTIAKTRTETQATSDLTDELYLLAAKENKTNEEKTKMAMLVSQLNKLMPTLNLQIDQQTGKLNKNKQAVTDLIAAKKKEIELAAYEERLLALYKERVEVTDSLKEAQDKLTAAKKAMSEADNQYERDFNNTALLSAQEAVDAYGISLNNVEADIKSAGDAYDSMATTVTVATDAVVVASIKTEEQISSDIAKSREVQKQHEEDTKKYYSELESATEKHMTEMGSLDDKGIEKSKLTAKQVKKNLERQIKDFQEWRKDIKKLSGKVPEEVMQELEALGPAASIMIDDLTKMTPEKLQEWVDVWQLKGKEASDAAKEELINLPGAVYKLGQDTGFQFNKGLDEITGNVALTAAELAKAAIPKVNLRKTGQDIGGGFIKGLNDTIEGIKGAAQNMQDALNEKLGNTTQYSGHTPEFAGGVTNFSGGLARVNKKGGEIQYLPKGTTVLPNDLSTRLIDSVSKAVGAALGRTAGGSGASAAEIVAAMEGIEIKVDDRSFGRIVRRYVS